MWECPECGCEDITVIREPDATPLGYWFDTGEARCNYCGQHFRFKNEPKKEEPPEPDPDDLPPGFVAYHVIRCPECNSDKTKTTSTRRPIRWHKCHICGHAFRSKEA